MAKKNEDRFVFVHKEGSELSDKGQRQLMVDRVTNVTYVVWKCGYAGGITPLLSSDGQPILTPLRTLSGNPLLFNCRDESAQSGVKRDR